MFCRYLDFFSLLKIYAFILESEGVLVGQGDGEEGGRES